MSDVAKLTVTSGPDRGRVFDLAEELVHIGRGPDNQVVLADPTIADHQASIVQRSGRFAIYTPLSDTVDVDGDTIPSDQWVWLPVEARIKIGERTSVRFTCSNGEGVDADADPPESSAKSPAGSKRGSKSSVAAVAPSAPPPTAESGGDAGDTVDPFADDEELPNVKESKRGRKRRRRRAGGEKGGGDKRQVARFVTDQSGDTVVTLGADGQLPDLKLREGAATRERRAEQRETKEGTSPALYVMLLVSMVSTAGLLLLDFEPGQTSARQRAAARQELRGFIGTGEQAPENYQTHLREAVLARQRNDATAERAAYRRVLDLLNAVPDDDLLGLTGNPDRDDRLRELIGVLLSR